ncbi:8-amino-7-oxononanoate synthase [Uliginosibacterium gangwonense]|uniref:8-amino-7-oxononanoate synthase n=1 Tax=Uliginosibacterium gangwonense TaxID=392736 RepID=UPI0003644040|nr:8-amino-7-oxononanoate synthase [Uliginosibacterium gangwonense]
MPSRHNILEELATKLAEVRQSDLFRQRRAATLPCSPLYDYAGQSFLSFASNDYLGLANSTALIEAAQRGAKRWGVGSGASHLVSGHTLAHDALEQRLAAFTGFEACLSFSTGYLANLAVPPALLGRGDAIFADRLNHASLVDATQLARADLTRYPHLDLVRLDNALQASKAVRKMIISDAVFSMDGDIAPLADLIKLADKHDAWLLIDDAHGFGVLGPQGRGSLAEITERSPRLILMGTLGKAAGVAGAFVAGSATVIDWLLQKARPYIFTTASPPLLAETLLCALDLIEHGDALRAQLNRNIELLRNSLHLRRFRLLPSRTAIQPIVVGDNAVALKASTRLRELGLYVPAIRPPTVPTGSARLRISLSAAHTEADTKRLVDALHTIENELA